MTILATLNQTKPNAVFFNFDGFFKFSNSLKYHALKNTLAKYLDLNSNKKVQAQLKNLAKGLDREHNLRQDVQGVLTANGIDTKLPMNFKTSYSKEKNELIKKSNKIHHLILLNEAIKSKEIAVVSNFSIEFKKGAARKAFKESSIFNVFQKNHFIEQENALSSKAYQDFLDEQNVLENEDEAPMVLAMHKFKVKPEQTIVLVDNLNALKIAIRLGLKPIVYLGFIFDEYEKSKLKAEMLKIISKDLIFE
jgi:hypothetical protein